MNQNYRNFRRVATHGNLGLVAPNLDACVDETIWNVKAGQFMLFDNETNKTIAPADIAAAKYPMWVMGVGKKKGGRAHDVVVIGTKEFNPCIDKVAVDFTRPRCVVEEEAAIEIGCVSCDTGYPIEILARSPLTKFYYGREGEMRYLFNYATDCTPGCEADCKEGSVSAIEVAKGYVADIKQRTGKVEIFGSGGIVFDNSDIHYVPFVGAAVEQGDKVYKFCLDVVSDDCGKCIGVKAVKEIVVTPKVCPGETAVDYTINLEAYASDGVFAFEDLDAIMERVAKEVDPRGGSVVINSTTNCCPAEVKMAGCMAGVAATDTDDAVITICEEDPFVDIAVDEDCNCGTITSTRKAESLVLIWMKSARQLCDCDLPSDALNYADTRAMITQVNFLGQVWHKNKHGWLKLRTYQDGEGSGYHAMLNAISMNAPSEGTFEHRGSRDRYGKFQNVSPEGFEMWHQVAMYTCSETYCGINMVISRDHKVWGTNADTRHNDEAFVIDIPWGDTNDQDAAKAILDAWVATGNCNVIGEGCRTEHGAAYVFGGCATCP